MKLSLRQTKELLERVERKINLEEDAPINAMSRKGAPPTPTFGGLMAAREKERPEKMRKELASRAKRIVDEADPRKKEPMSEELLAVMEKIANMEEVTEKEIKNVLSGLKFGAIMQILQSYLKGVLGVSL